MDKESYPDNQVGRWMSTEVITAKPGTFLADALEKMESFRIRHLPVLDEGELVGIVSSRDARRAAAAPSPEAGYETLQRTPVRDVMTGERLSTVEPYTSVRDAAEMVCREKISALPVVRGKKLVGIVTSEDLLWAFLEQPEEPPE